MRLRLEGGHFITNGRAAIGGGTVILHLQPGLTALALSPTGALPWSSPLCLLCPSPSPQLKPEPSVCGFHAGSGGPELPSSSRFSPLWVLPYQGTSRDASLRQPTWPPFLLGSPLLEGNQAAEMECWWLRKGPYTSWFSLPSPHQSAASEANGTGWGGLHLGLCLSGLISKKLTLAESILGVFLLTLRLLC